MKRGHFLVGIFLILLLLAGCSLQDDLPLLKVPPTALGPEKSLQQRLTLTWGEKSHVLESVMDIRDTNIQIIALAMGLRIYSLQYDGQTLVPGPGLLPAGLSEARILNDQLVIYLPAAALQETLPSGWLMQESRQAGETLQRFLFQEGELIMTIQYDAGAPWNGRSLLTNHRRNYQLILDSVSEP